MEGIDKLINVADFVFDYKYPIFKNSTNEATIRMSDDVVLRIRIDDDEFAIISVDGHEDKFWYREKIVHEIRISLEFAGVELFLPYIKPK